MWVLAYAAVCLLLLAVVSGLTAHELPKYNRLRWLAHGISFYSFIAGFGTAIAAIASAFGFM